MASVLPIEFSTFSKVSKQLRQIHRDTQRCFNDINSASKFDCGANFKAELSKDEELEITKIIKKPPALIVLGQDTQARAILTNEIFGKPILPTSNSEDNSITWRLTRFKYGEKINVSLALPGSYELVESLASHRQKWQTIPKEDLEINNTVKSKKDEAKKLAALEVKLTHPLLKDGGQVLVVPWEYSRSVEDLYNVVTDNVVPVFLYAINEDELKRTDIELLEQFRAVNPSTTILFIRVAHDSQHYRSLSPKLQVDNNNQDQLSTSPIRTLQNSVHRFTRTKSKESTVHKRSANLSLNIFQQLMELGYLSLLPSSANINDDGLNGCIPESELIENLENLHPLVKYTRQVLKNHLVRTTSILNLIHNRCLETFISTAFDMARDLLITPRRLEFARQKESELFASLMDIAIRKQDEIRKLISETISNMRPILIERASSYEFPGLELPENYEVTSPKNLKICTVRIQELVLDGLNSAIAGQLLESVDILKDSYTGVLTRCLESLEQHDNDGADSIRTSIALREILNSAYQVEITIRAGASFVRVLLEKMKQLIQGMPWHTPPKTDAEWRKKVASDMMDSLSDSRLAKSICVQIKERLKQSHESFAVALKQLETRHSGRLERTEEQRLRVRKVHAPRVARLALESISLKDCVMYGMPVMGREVGRGQYGVVYSCDSWSSYGPCAIKSVVPPDEKHWNDLALEFYYTKNVPEHDRIVALRGSVIDYTYGGGSSPAVLLIMDRLQRDLYAAIKMGLGWLNRLRVAIDVVEGIRFLHSQGLVHRDIKLKNVLLDNGNRGRLTDLGFCKPEAMMSGSIVGTPIHMAPELFTGRYDNSVDVYAFGILFWYVCAGHVRLPYTFEQCTSKDMLWTSVRRGVRPEKLPQFDEECWDLMQTCWHGEPSKRPLLGNVEPQLTQILERYQSLKLHGARSPSSHKNSHRTHKIPSGSSKP